MSSYIPEGYGELAIYWNLSSDPEPMVTTFGFKITGDGTDPAGIADDIRPTLVGTGKLIDVATMYTTTQLTKLRVTTRSGGDLYQGENATVAIGTVSTTTTVHPPPNNCAFLIQKKSAILGRRNRGRSFWPINDVATTAINQLGNIDASVVSAKQTLYNSWWTAMNVTLDLDLYILHSVSEIAPTPVQSLVFSSKIATQRRRMRP